MSSCYDYQFSTTTYNYINGATSYAYTYCYDGTSCYNTQTYSYGYNLVYVAGVCDDGLTGWALAIIIIIPILILIVAIIACIKRKRQQQLMMNTMAAE